MDPTSIANSMKSSTKNSNLFTSKIQSAMLTKTDRELLKNIAVGGVAFASTKMHVERSYSYQRLYRIRKKIKKSQAFINEINRFRKNSPRLRKLLMVVDDGQFASFGDI